MIRMLRATASASTTKTPMGGLTIGAMRAMHGAANTQRIVIADAVPRCSMKQSAKTVEVSVILVRC